MTCHISRLRDSRVAFKCTHTLLSSLCLLALNRRATVGICNSMSKAACIHCKRLRDMERLPLKMVTGTYCCTAGDVLTWTRASRRAGVHRQGAADDEGVLAGHRRPGARSRGWRSTKEHTLSQSRRAAKRRTDCPLVASVCTVHRVAVSRSITKSQRGLFQQIVC